MELGEGGYQYWFSHMRIDKLECNYKMFGYLKHSLVALALHGSRTADCIEGELVGPISVADLQLRLKHQHLHQHSIYKH